MDNRIGLRRTPLFFSRRCARAAWHRIGHGSNPRVDVMKQAAWRRVRGRDDILVDAPRERPVSEQLNGSCRLQWTDRRQTAGGQIAPVDGVVARTLERLLRTRSRTVELYGLLFATDRRSPVLSSCHVGAYIRVGCQSEPTGNQQDFVAAPLTHRREEWQRAVCMIWLEHSTEEDVHLLGDLLALVGQRAMTAVC